MLAADSGTVGQPGLAWLSLFKFCVFRDWIIMRARVGAREGDQWCLSKIAMLMAKLGSVFGFIHSRQLSGSVLE